MHKRYLPIVLFGVVLFPLAASAVIFPRDEGTWPKDWPAELEPYRKVSRTIEVATGIQEDYYEIPIADRATFEKVWPAVLKVRTPGSPITLAKDTYWDFSRLKKPGAKDAKPVEVKRPAAIWIRGPAASVNPLTRDAIDVKNPPDYGKLIAEGKALRLGQWSDEIVGPSGELPEYVVDDTSGEKMKWIAADPHNPEDRKRGFFFRARIEIGLVVDGQVIDLNQVQFPERVEIIDKRFEKPKE